MGSPRRVAVLGAAGFIGSHLADTLEAEGHDVRRVDKVDGWGIWRADLRNPQEVLAAIADREWVFHLAADMGGVGYFHSDADYKASTDNARISLNVLGACEHADIDRLFFSSSACVYPIEQQIRPHEEWEIGQGTPDQLYGAEKLFTLQACAKLPYARVGVLHTVYGPGQEATGQRAKFPPSVCWKALQAAETGTMTLWGDGTQRRSYLYIDDAVRRILAVMEADHYDGPVNIGYEGTITCREAAVLAANAVGIDPDIICDPKAGPTGVVYRDCDNTKWRAVYGATNDLHPAEGLARLVDSLR